MGARRQVIINADDFGYDPAVTEGIRRSAREGIVRSTTFMVNTPHSAAAAADTAGLAVGLHLNLARHAPCGVDFPAEWLERGELSEARAAGLPAEVVEAEVHAQCERLEALLGRPPTHVDVHKHLHRHAGVLEGLARAARKRGLPVRSVDAAMRSALRAAGVRTNPHFVGDAGAEAYWTEAELERQLQALPDGVTELMCHPGLTPSHVRSGYAAQREVELATFTSRRAADLVEALGLELVSFATMRE
jgi:predicted glycoside hydrolase/deacetylase ChbG (UPF0249 family)